MQKTEKNIDHQIQLKLDEIERYKFHSRNYPANRLVLRDLYLKSLEEDLAEMNKIKEKYAIRHNPSRSD